MLLLQDIVLPAWNMVDGAYAIYFISQLILARIDKVIYPWYQSIMLLNIFWE